MAIRKWEPFGDLDRFWGDLSPSLHRNLGFDLAVDVYEEDNNIVAKMNVPGVDPNKIDISIEDNMLRIRGSVDEEQEEEKKNYYRKEMRQGSFERRIRLPSSVENENISAEYDQGVLKILLPKSKESMASKKIEVKVKGKDNM